MVPTAADPDLHPSWLLPGWGTNPEFDDRPGPGIGVIHYNSGAAAAAAAARERTRRSRPTESHVVRRPDGGSGAYGQLLYAVISDWIVLSASTIDSPTETVRVVDAMLGPPNVVMASSAWSSVMVATSASSPLSAPLA